MLVDGQDSGVRRTPVRLVDGSMAAHVRFDAVQAQPLTVPAGMWAEAQALAGLSIVAALVGAMASLLDLTVDSVRKSHQFGKPIESFQVVQHRCARQYTWLEQYRTFLFKSALTDEVGRGTAVQEAGGQLGG